MPPGSRRDRVIWVINSACPSRCVYCDIESQRSTRELAGDRTLNAARQVVDEGFRQVIFVGGEPLMYRPLGDVLELLRGRSDNAVFTGGIPGDPQRWVDVVGRGASRMVYSIDVGLGRINDRIRGRLGTTRDLTGIAEAIARQLPSVEASVSTVVSRQSVEHVATVWDRMKAYDLTAWVAVLAGDNFTGTPGEHFLTPEQLVGFYRRTVPDLARRVAEESPGTDFLVFPHPMPFLQRGIPSREWDVHWERLEPELEPELERFARGAYNETFSARHGCPLVGSDITIGVGGQIYPCSQAPIIQDRFALGRLDERRLSDLLSEPALETFRQGVPHEPCSRCWAPSNVPRATLEALFRREARA